MFCERVSASVGREYCRYLVPALGATLSTSFYLFADTVMVGHRLGGEALAALNVMVPLEFACFAVGAWLGNGGAIGVTRSQGNGALAVARGVWRTLELAVAFAVLSWPVGVGAMLVLVYGVLGADAPPSLTAAALDYGRWIALGSPCFVLGAVLPPLLRHTGAPRRAMGAVVCGGVANIALDWLFLYPLGWGIGGAAVATVLGSALSVGVMLPQVLEWLTVGGFRACSAQRWRSYGSILHTGAGAFLQELSGCVTFLLFNHFLLARFGEVGVILYTIPANVSLVAMALFNGVAHAAQPMVAHFCQSGARMQLRQVLRLSGWTALGMGTVMGVYGCWMPEHLIALFLDGPTASALPPQAYGAIAVALAALPITSLVHLRVFQLPALGRASEGALFSCLRNGALSLPLAWLLARLVGPWQLWWCFLLADLLILLCLPLPSVRAELSGSAR